MQKLKYTIYDALINFYRRRSVNIIVAVSFALGMLLPILCLGNINIFVENVSTMRYKNDDNVWTVSFNGGEVSLEGLLSSMEEFPLEIEDMAIYAQTSGTVEINNVKSDGFMKYVTEDWLEFDNCKVIDGSLDLFEESNVCLIEQSYAENPDEIKAGDRIKLFGKTYTVKGVFSCFNHYGSILLPLHAGDNEVQDVVINKLYLRTKTGTLNENEIVNALKAVGLPASRVKSGKDVYHDGLINGISRSLGIFAVGAAAFAFAAINICLVLIGKLNLDKRNYGIRMALGANYGHVRMSALLENLLCFCMAFLCDIALIHVLKPTYPERLTMILNARVYATALLFGIFMTMIVTHAALARLKKKKLVELFERVS